VNLIRQSAARFTLAALLLLAIAVPVWAHHSPSAIFDMNKKYSLTGTLTTLNWVNPHIVMFIDAENGEKWRFETNPPAWFKSVGVSRADFSKSIGQTVTVDCVRARDGSTYGYLYKIKLADGTSLELASPEKEAPQPTAK
jgi:hypothetical protein